MLWVPPVNTTSRTGYDDFSRSGSMDSDRSVEAANSSLALEGIRERILLLRWINRCLVEARIVGHDAAFPHEAGRHAAGADSGWCRELNARSKTQTRLCSGSESVPAKDHSVALKIGVYFTQVCEKTVYMPTAKGNSSSVYRSPTSPFLKFVLYLP